MIDSEDEATQIREKPALASEEHVPDEDEEQTEEPKIRCRKESIRDVERAGIPEKIQQAEPTRGEKDVKANTNR